MDIKFDDNTVKEIVTAAIVKQLGDSKTLVDDAVRYLISTKKVKVGYQEQETQPLQEAFHTAIERHATHVIVEHLRADERVKIAIEGMTTKIVEELLQDLSHDVAYGIAESVRKHLKTQS